MKTKIRHSIIAIAFISLSHAQMYVSPNSYVFVNDQFVFVREDVNLAADGNVFLRNQSQLLQGTSGAGANSGLGNLSVFQEGTVNNFQYNYWCSPVGVPAAGSGNSTFGVSRLHRPTGLTTSSAATILPFNNLDGVSNPLAIAQRWIYTFTTSNAYAQWNFVGPNNTIVAGLGFTMKGTSGTDGLIADATDGVTNNAGSRQRYDFRGKPNDGTITNLVSANNYTLVGNPYASAIDLNAFLLDPANAAVINGQAYFWEQVVVNSHYIDAYSGGYGVYTPGGGYTPAAFWNFDNNGGYETNLGATGTYFERRFTPVGQGFMVRGTSNGSIAMRNSFRVYRKEGAAFNSEFARNANAEETSEYFEAIPNVAGTDYTQVKKGFAPQLRIHAMYNNGGIRPTTLGFDPTTTDGFDYGFDGRLPSSEAAEFYYIVEGSPHEYVMNITSFDIEKRIPVGFRNQAQTNFKIKVVDVLYGFDAIQKVYIHDKENDIYYDIKDGMFDMTLPAGNNKTRFEITFKNFNDTLSTPDDVLAALQVFQNNTNSMLTVVNTLNKDIITLEMYDVTGKRVINKTKLGTSSQIEISTSSLSDGVYIVTLKTNEGLTLSRKVSVYKN